MNQLTELGLQVTSIGRRGWIGHEEELFKIAEELRDALVACHAGFSYVNPQTEAHRRHTDQLSKIPSLLKKYAGSD